MVKQREGFKIIISDKAKRRIDRDECPACGKPKKQWERRTDWRCCSTKCSKKFYKDYYTLGWQELRFKAFERDKHTCIKCGKQPKVQRQAEKDGQMLWFDTEQPDDSQLIGDHTTAIALGGDEWDIKNVQTLCKECDKIKTKSDKAKIALLRRKEKKMEEIRKNANLLNTDNLTGIYLRLSEDDKKPSKEEKPALIDGIEKIKQFCTDKSIIMTYKGNLHSYAYNSIINQFELSMDYIKKERLTLKYLFLDKETGWNVGRFAYQEIIKLTKEKKLNLLLVKRYSRFGRNAPERETTIRNIESGGAKVFSILEPSLADSDNVSFRQMQGVMDEHVVLLNRKNQEILIQSKLDKGLPFTKAPRGYKNKKKRWVTDVKRAKEIKEIFNMTKDMAKNKETHKDICKKFKISAPTYYKIIKNRAYLGKVVYWHYIKDPQGKVIKKERIELDGKHEAIVSEELFNAVNKTSQA